MADQGKAVGGRGASWKEKEILNLLTFWREEKIQESLKTCHRNFDCYVKVAEQMALRGHNRSAIECRSKAKTMRLQYKQVVAHNNRSGNAPATCSYYRELDRILCGDASIRPKRVSRGIILQVMEENRLDLVQLQEGSEELFSDEYVGVFPAPVDTSTPFLREYEENREQELCSVDHDLDATIEGLDNCGRGGNSPTADEMTNLGEKENDPPMRSPSGLDCQETPSRPLAEESPESHLANLRTRKWRSAGLYSVAEKLMSHSSQQHALELEERCREQQEAREWHQEYMTENRQEWILFQDAFSKNYDVLTNAVNALHNIGEALLVRNLVPNHSDVANIPPAITSHPERVGQPKRSCVGRVRNRLTM